MATFIFPSVNDIYGAGSVGDGVTITEANLKTLLGALPHNSSYIIEDYQVSNPSGLDVATSATSAAYINGWYVYDSSSLTGTVSASATNYVFLTVSVDGSGNATGTTLTINTSGTEPANSILLAIVTTVGGAVTTIEDRRVTTSPIYGIRACGVSRNTTQSIPNNTWTSISFNGTSGYDTDFAWNSSNPTRITPPSWARYLNFTAAVDWASSGTGRREMLLTKNGAAADSLLYSTITPQGSGKDFQQATSGWIVAGAPGTDYYEIDVYQSSGGALNVGNQNLAATVEFRA